MLCERGAGARHSSAAQKIAALCEGALERVGLCVERRERLVGQVGGGELCGRLGEAVRAGRQLDVEGDERRQQRSLVAKAKPDRVGRRRFRGHDR